MALKIYEVEHNGHRTTVQLTDEDAETRGLTEADTVEARARAAEEADADAEADRTAAEEAAAADAAAAKAAAPANKGRTAANKAAEK